MPAVLDAPPSVELPEVSTLARTSFPVQEVQPGFWRRLAQSVTRPHIVHERYTSCGDYVPRPPLETHQDLLARKYPTLYILACSGV